MNRIKLVQLIKEVIAEAEEIKYTDRKDITDIVFQAIKNGQLVMAGLDEFTPELIKNRFQADKRVADALAANKKITVDGVDVLTLTKPRTITPSEPKSDLLPGATPMGYGGTGFGRGGQFYAGD